MSIGQIIAAIVFIATLIPCFFYGMKDSEFEIFTKLK